MCGSHVWDFGDCFEAQLMFFTAFCNLSAGVFLTDAQGGGLHLFDAGGFPIHRYTERDIENRLRKADYVRCAEERCRDISDMSSVRMMYRQELCRQAGDGLEKLEVRIESPSDHIRRVMEDCLARLGCGQGAGVRFVIHPSGTTVSAYGESGPRGRMSPCRTARRDISISSPGNTDGAPSAIPSPPSGRRITRRGRSGRISSGCGMGSS